VSGGIAFRPNQIAIRKYGSGNGGDDRRNRHASGECEAKRENYSYLLHDRIPLIVDSLPITPAGYRGSGRPAIVRSLIQPIRWYRM
jgi:hypothetical protein